MILVISNSSRFRKNLLGRLYKLIMTTIDVKTND